MYYYMLICLFPSTVVHVEQLHPNRNIVVRLLLVTMCTINLTFLIHILFFIYSCASWTRSSSNTYSTSCPVIRSASFAFCLLRLYRHQPSGKYSLRNSVYSVNAKSMCDLSVYISPTTRYLKQYYSHSGYCAYIGTNNQVNILLRNFVYSVWNTV